MKLIRRSKIKMAEEQAVAEEETKKFSAEIKKLGDKLVKLTLSDAV